MNGGNFYFAYLVKTGDSIKIRIDQINFTSIAAVFTQIGGTFTVFYGLISFLSNFFHWIGWETNVLSSVFGNIKPD